MIKKYMYINNERNEKINLIYLLFIILIILLVFEFLYNKKDIMEPAFLFCASFAIASFVACIYANKWNLNLHLNTFLVILLRSIRICNCITYN